MILAIYTKKTSNPVGVKYKSLTFLQNEFFPVCPVCPVCRQAGDRQATGRQFLNNH